MPVAALSLLGLLAACEASKVPEDASRWAVTVTGQHDGCHPERTDGYQETFDYAVAFDASSATLYIGENAFASGTISGCSLTYQSVVFEQERDEGTLKVQLFGQAAVESVGGDPCVENTELEWEGTEWFEVISSEDPDVEPGCTYDMTTEGTLG